MRLEPRPRRHRPPSAGPAAARGQAPGNQGGRRRPGQAGPCRSSVPPSHAPEPRAGTLALYALLPRQVALDAVASAVTTPPALAKRLLALRRILDDGPAAVASPGAAGATEAVTGAASASNKRWQPSPYELRTGTRAQRTGAPCRLNPLQRIVLKGAAPRGWPREGNLSCPSAATGCERLPGQDPRPGQRAHCRTAGPPPPPPYLIWSYTLNIGRYIAITMRPTIEPTITIMIGSRIEVSALTAASTCSS